MDNQVSWCRHWCRRLHDRSLTASNVLQDLFQSNLRGIILLQVLAIGMASRIRGADRELA